MKNANLYCLFAEAIRHAGDRQFLLIPNGPGIRYSELEYQLGRYQSLLAGLDVNKGDRVMVQVEKSIEAVLVYLACLRLGAVYVPLNTAYTATEVAYFISDAQPQLFICPDDQAAAISHLDIAHVLTLSADGRGTLIDGLQEQAETGEIVQCDANDLAAILYTSGTTGRSKGAMLSHENLASNAQVLHQFWHFEAGDVLLHALPIFHVHGLFVALHCALLNGSTVHFLPRFDISQVLELLPESTVMMGVPTFYTRLLATQGFDRPVCENMRLFVAGSAPLLAETHREFEARTGHRILERYGMTETGMISSNPYDGERLAGTVGYALPATQARVANEHGVELPRGDTGTLEVKGPNVFQGYWHMPDKTQEEFRDDGWFITGDLATMADDGRITIVGRAKDLIISGGYNVYPKEVEMAIDDIDGVKESAVIGVPHPDFGEAVVAVVVGGDDTSLNEADIVEPLANRLARFKQPKQVYFVGELPRNTMGKVQKNQLRQEYKDRFQ